MKKIIVLVCIYSGSKMVLKMIFLNNGNMYVGRGAKWFFLIHIQVWRGVMWLTHLVNDALTKTFGMLTPP